MHFFEFHFIKTGHLIHHLHLSHNSTCILKVTMVLHDTFSHNCICILKVTMVLPPAPSPTPTDQSPDQSLPRAPGSLADIKN